MIQSPDCRARVPSALQGEPEIGWVVMRALEKDRAQRYKSAGAFGNDNERYLRTDEVAAGAPSTVYRLRRLARQAEREAAAVSEILQNGLLARVSSHVRASSTGRRRGLRGDSRDRRWWRRRCRTRSRRRWTRRIYWC